MLKIIVIHHSIGSEVRLTQPLVQSEGGAVPLRIEPIGNIYASQALGVSSQTSPLSDCLRCLEKDGNIPAIHEFRSLEKGAINDKYTIG